LNPAEEEKEDDSESGIEKDNHNWPKEKYSKQRRTSKTQNRYYKSFQNEEEILVDNLPVIAQFQSKFCLKISIIGSEVKNIVCVLKQVEYFLQPFFFYFLKHFFISESINLINSVKRKSICSIYWLIVAIYCCQNLLSLFCNRTILHLKKNKENKINYAIELI